MWTHAQDLAETRTDSELCLAVTNGGSQAAFAALHGRYRDRIFRLAATFLGSPDDAEDVTQEVFVRAYKAIDHFKGQSQFFTWLYRIALNCCKDWAKQAYRVRCDSRDDLWWSACSEDRSPYTGPVRVEHEVEQREARVFLEEALATLPSDFRDALILREVDGLSYREIGQVLACSEGTVKSRIFRARHQMRRSLQSLRPFL